MGGRARQTYLSDGRVQSVVGGLQVLQVRSTGVEQPRLTQHVPRERLDSDQDGTG